MYANAGPGLPLQEFIRERPSAENLTPARDLRPSHEDRLEIAVPDQLPQPHDLRAAPGASNDVLRGVGRVENDEHAFACRPGLVDTLVEITHLTTVAQLGEPGCRS
jgi:hypothetical protein